MLKRLLLVVDRGLTDSRRTAAATAALMVSVVVLITEAVAAFPLNWLNLSEEVHPLERAPFQLPSTMESAAKV